MTEDKRVPLQGPARHCMTPGDRIEAIVKESPVVKTPKIEDELCSYRFVDRYDFNFLIQMAVKGAEVRNDRR